VTSKKRDSVYQSKIVSSDGVKKKITFQGIPVHIDRPVGLIMTGRSKSGEEWAREYLYDYGFIPGTLGGDGDDLDVFIGPKEDAKEVYWAIQRKEDGSFDEFKVFLGFSSRDAAIAAYREHIPLKLLDGMVSMRLDMVKALLGIHPTGEFAKLAQIDRRTLMTAVSFTDARARLS